MRVAPNQRMELAGAAFKRKRYVVRQRTCGDAWARGAPAGAAPQLMRDSLGGCV